MKDKYTIGKKVKKNPETWKPNDFDGWGRGEGIGTIVEEIDEKEVDVKWTSGRCHEFIDELILVEE